MDYLFKLIFIFIIFIFAWLYQEENQTWDKTRNLLKDANNFATHDAAQEEDRSSLGLGKVIIDPVKARERLEETLRLNLGLDASLNPMPGSPVYGQIRIIHFEILDDSNTVFPYLYDNPGYTLSKWLTGPAVVAVIEIDHPSFVNRVVEKAPIRVPSISGYDPDE